MKYLSSLRTRPSVRCATPTKYAGHLFYNIMDELSLSCGSGSTALDSSSTELSTPVRNSIGKATKNSITSTSSSERNEVNLHTKPTKTTTTKTTTITTTTIITKIIRTTTSPSTTYFETLLLGTDRGASRNPEFSLTPSDTVVNVNETIELSCRARNENDFLGWKRNNDRLIDPRNQDQRIQLHQNGVTISPAQLSDVGLYTCQIINADGHREYSVLVNVLSKPHIIRTQGKN